MDFANICLIVCSLCLGDLSVVGECVHLFFCNLFLKQLLLRYFCWHECYLRSHDPSFQKSAYSVLGLLSDLGVLIYRVCSIVDFEGRRWWGDQILSQSAVGLALPFSISYNGYHFLQLVFKVSQE